jgi:hypothetical protein
MTSCDYRFSEGQRYLVYARRMPDGRWTASDCSGTKPADEAIEDLAFIQSVPGLPPGGRIYGDAQRVRRAATGTSEPEVTPLAGLRATFTNDRAQYEIVSGADGRFDIVVPAGTYTARPGIPTTLKAYYPRTLTVADRGCAPTFFHVVSNGRVAGVARTPAGRPIARAMVHLLPVEAVTEEQVRAVSLNSATTDPRGRFEIDALPAGRYVLGINVRFGPRLESPYYAFHPAASDRAGAATIEVREGELTAGVEIAADRLPPGVIAGIVLDGTGRPVTRARIVVGPAVSPFSYSGGAVSDAEGRFTLNVVGRTTYVVRASLGTGPSFRESAATVRVEDRTGECTLVLGEPLGR